MKKNKVIEKTELTCGSLNEAAFWSLIGLQVKRKDSITASLRDYYVEGLSMFQSYTNRGVNKNTFYRSKATFQNTFDLIQQFNENFKLSDLP